MCIFIVSQHEKVFLVNIKFKSEKLTYWNIAIFHNRDTSFLGIYKYSQSWLNTLFQSSNLYINNGIPINKVVW